LRDILAAKAARADGIVIGLLKKSGHVDAERMAIVRQVMGSDMILTFHRAFDVCRLGSEGAEGEEDAHSKAGKGKEDKGKGEEHDATKEVAAITTTLKNATQDGMREEALLMRQTIDMLVCIKCNRLLTSGRAASALRGVSVIKNVADYLESSSATALPSLVVVAAAGVGAGNVASIIEQSGVRAVHAGSSICTRKVCSSTIIAGRSAAGEGEGAEAGVVNMGLTGGDGSASDVYAWDIVDRAAVGVLVHAAGKAWQLAGIELEEKIGDDDEQHGQQHHQHQESKETLGDDGDIIEELNVDFPPTPPPTPPPLSTSPPPLPQISPSISSSSISASSGLGGSFVLL